MLSDRGGLGGVKYSAVARYPVKIRTTVVRCLPTMLRDTLYVTGTGQANKLHGSEKSLLARILLVL